MKDVTYYQIYDSAGYLRMESDNWRMVDTYLDYLSRFCCPRLEVRYGAYSGGTHYLAPA